MPFALLMLAVAEWEFVRALELAAVNVPAKVMWSRMAYLGIASIPPWRAAMLSGCAGFPFV
jgi:hypothetical protein